MICNKIKVFLVMIVGIMGISYGNISGVAKNINTNTNSKGSEFKAPKAALKGSYFSDAPNMAMEGDILLPLVAGNHTLFTEGHMVKRVGSPQYELNTGVGYRYLVNRNNLVGVYSFFDHNVTQFGSGFNQATVGGEWFHGLWEGRSNVYMPLSEERIVSVQGIGVHWKDVGEGVREGSVYVNQVKETPLYGFDLIGGRHIGSFYIGAGGFAFGRSGYESVVGPKVNAKYEWNIGKHYVEGIRFESEVSYDEVRGVRSYGGVRIAFGDNKEGISVASHRFDFVQRDIDIVTNSKKEEASYNDVTGKNVRIIDGNIPPTTCTSGTIWHVTGTANLTQTYNACSGSSIAGQSTSLEINGKEYTLNFPGAEGANNYPIIQASSSFVGNLIQLDGNNTISGVKLINIKDLNYSTLSLDQKNTSQSFGNIVLTNIESDGRILLKHPFGVNNTVTLSLSNVKAYIDAVGAEKVETTLSGANGENYTYAAGVIEIIDEGAFLPIIGKTNITVTSLNNISISTGVNMAYSGILIGSPSSAKHSSIHINDGISFATGSSVYLSKNGETKPSLIFLGKGVTFSGDITFPQSMSLKYAYGLVNTVDVSKVTTDAKSSMILTDSTLIDNYGTINTIDIAGTYTTRDAHILYNHRYIGTYSQYGTLTNYTNTGIVYNVGNIDTVNLHDMNIIYKIPDVYERVSPNAGFIDNAGVENNPVDPLQLGGTIGTINVSGDINATGILVFIRNHPYATIDTINMTGNFTFTRGAIIEVGANGEHDGSGAVHHINLNGNIHIKNANGTWVDYYKTAYILYTDTCDVGDVKECTPQDALETFNINGTITVDHFGLYPIIMFDGGLIQLVTYNATLNVGTIAPVAPGTLRYSNSFITNNAAYVDYHDESTGGIQKIVFNKVPNIPGGIILADPSGITRVLEVHVPIDFKDASKTTLLWGGLKSYGSYVKYIYEISGNQVQSINNDVFANRMIMTDNSGTNPLESKYIKYGIELKNVSFSIFSGVKTLLNYNSALRSHFTSAPTINIISSSLTFPKASFIKIYPGESVPSITMSDTQIGVGAVAIDNQGKIDNITTTNTHVLPTGICIKNTGVISHHTLDAGCKIQ